MELRISGPERPLSHGEIHSSHEFISPTFTFFHGSRKNKKF